MLGRKDYTEDEIGRARAAVEQQLGAYRALEAAVAASADPAAVAALEALEPVLFGNLVLVLDRYFVHRVRPVTGKDSNPLNEVELLADSVLGNDGVLRTGTVVRYRPAETVLGLEPGERIVLTPDRYEELAKAYLAEVERRFR